MKKYMITMGLAASMILAACGLEEENNSEQTEEKVETAEEETTTESSVAEESTEDETVAESDDVAEDKEEVPEEDAEEPAEDAFVEGSDENIMEDEDMRTEVTFMDKELAITGSSGPIEYAISGIGFMTLEVKSERMATLLDSTVGETLEMFLLNISAENTSDEDVFFNIMDATAITNTKEQLYYQPFISDFTGIEYLGQVQHEGVIAYALENSSLDDLETIEVRFSQPLDVDYKSLGEDTKEMITISR